MSAAAVVKVISTTVLKCWTTYWTWWMFESQWTLSRTWWGFVSTGTIQQWTRTGFESCWALGWTWRCPESWADIWFVNWTKRATMNRTVMVLWTVNRTWWAIADDGTWSTAIGETTGWGSNSVFHNVCATEAVVYRCVTAFCKKPNWSLIQYSCYPLAAESLLHINTNENTLLCPSFLNKLDWYKDMTYILQQSYEYILPSTDFLIFTTVVLHGDYVIHKMVAKQWSNGEHTPYLHYEKWLYLPRNRGEKYGPLNETIS